MKKIRPLIIKILRNYFVMATLIFLVWVTFFDDNNLISQYQQRRELNLLLRQKKYLTDEIKKNKDTYRSLTTDVKFLQRFAREKYLMKRPNEDIYLIIPDTIRNE